MRRDVWITRSPRSGDVARTCKRQRRANAMQRGHVDRWPDAPIGSIVHIERSCRIVLRNGVLGRLEDPGR
jgi:hypothetical protein